MKILIVDDHAIVRAGLKQIIKESLRNVTVHEAENSNDLFNQLAKQEYDLLLLDITLPGISGLETLKEIKKSTPELPVLIVSIHSEDQYALRVLKAGASGFLTKNSAPEELVNAINIVIEGRKYITPTLAEKLAVNLELGTEKPPHERLSDREYQVMRMLASGNSVKQIAAELSLSAKTISTNRARILKKMQMKTTAEIIRYAIKQNLVD